MKRTISLFILLAMIIAAGNAQYFVEGSVEVDYNDSSVSLKDIVHNKKMSSDFYYNISPTVGYWLNDDFAVGAKASFYKRIDKRIIQDITGDPDLDIEFERRQPRWRFIVFGRYQLWGTEKLSLLVESSLYTGRSSTDEKTGSMTKKIESRTLIGINVTPFLVTYDLSDRFSLSTACNLFSLHISSLTIKNEDTGGENKYNECAIGSGGSIGSLLGFNIGFIYHF